MLIILYVPHTGHLFMQLEHLDMTFFGYSVLNWIYGFALADVIEFIIFDFLSFPGGVTAKRTVL